MDYGRLSRRELQALCKEHRIPANKTNVFMAEALGALLNAPKEKEQTMESIPDPAEVVKSKAILWRSTRSEKVADVLEASEVDDLSSQLAKSTVAAESENVTVEAACEDIHEASPELARESEVVAEPARVPRRRGMQSGKPNTKSTRSKKVADVPEASEDDHLSSQLGRSTVAAESENVTVEAACEDIHEASPELARESEVVADPARVPRRRGMQSGKPNTKPTLSSQVDAAAPASVEPTLEVVPEVNLGMKLSSSIQVVRDISTDLARSSERLASLDASEKNVLQAIAVSEVNALPMDSGTEAAESVEVQSTTVKEGENALMNIDLHSLSIRKLKKEVMIRGLSKRITTNVKA